LKEREFDGDPLVHQPKVEKALTLRNSRKPFELNCLKKKNFKD
jgi:hypothetical protein